MGNVNVKNEYKGNGNVRSECGNGEMLGENVLIAAMLVVNVGMLGVNVLIDAMLGVNDLISAI